MQFERFSRRVALCNFRVVRTDDMLLVFAR
jgi:hypothetical protein